MNFLKRKILQRKQKLSPTEEHNLMLEISNSIDINSVSMQFNLLYQSIIQPLYGQLRKNYIPPLNEDDLQDILQDGWRKVLEKRKTFAAGNSVYNWIYTICKNYTLNYLKKLSENEKKFGKKSISIVKQNENDNDYEIPDNNIGIEEQLNEKDLVYKILSVINNLEDKGDVYLAKERLINNLTFEELSKLKGKPTSTLHYRMNNIIKKLKTELEGLI